MCLSRNCVQDQLRIWMPIFSVHFQTEEHKVIMFMTTSPFAGTVIDKYFFTVLSCYFQLSHDQSSWESTVIQRLSEMLLAFLIHTEFESTVNLLCSSISSKQCICSSMMQVECRFSHPVPCPSNKRTPQLVQMWAHRMQSLIF